MAKKHLLKKGVAYLLSAAMVLTSNGLIPGVVKTASAAVDIPEPVINLGFDSGTSSGDTYTEGGVNYTLTDADIVNDPDDKTNKVFYNGGDTAGFMRSAQGAFKDTDFSNGLSVHMKVRPEVQASDWNYLFGLGYNDGSWHYIDGTIGFIMREGDPYEPHYPAEGWQPGNSVNSDCYYFKNADKCNKWYNLTYVYGKDGSSAIYVDGVPVVKCVFTGYEPIYSSISQKSDTIFSLGTTVIDNIEKSNAYYDDVKVYNETLTDVQVYKLATGKEVSSADKDALGKAIADAETVRAELYTTESVAAFKEKLDVAKLVQNDVSADQSAVDTAASALEAAKKALVLKPVDLTSDLVIDTDISNATSAIDKGNKKVIAGGYDINALGASSIGDGYIQSSSDGKPKSAGISLDKSVLDGVSLDKGFTFNIKWNDAGVKSPTTELENLIFTVNTDNPPFCEL